MINPTAVFDIKWMPGSENLFLAAHNDGSLVVYDKEKDDAIFVPDEHAASSGTPTRDRPALVVRKSVKSPAQRQNPVAFWKVCNQRINAVSFSPDGLNLAVVSADGRLRIIDFHNER
jgi:catabolite repression protein CreC